MPGLLDLLAGSGVPQGILSPVGDVIDARNRFRGLLHSPDVLQQQLMQQQLMPQPGGTAVREPTDLGKYKKALFEQKARADLERQLPAGLRGSELMDPKLYEMQKVQLLKLESQGRLPPYHPYFGYETGSRGPYETASGQQTHARDVQIASKKLDTDLLAKINLWGDRVGASPWVRGNAIMDAANIKAAANAWKSYSGNLFPEIMPPAMQYPLGKLPKEE